MVRARSGLSVGMFFPARDEPSGKEIVVGAGVAVTSFLPMLDRHASRHVDIAAYVLRESADKVRARLRAGKRRSRVAVHTLDELARADRKIPSVWHDINSDVRRPFAFRHAAQSRFPISITHHTVSYTFFVHDWYLPLLLGDVRPFDTIVCTSVAARTAIANVLEQLGDSLGRAHGTRVRYRGRLDVLPLGVDTELFRPQPRAALRKRLKLPIDRDIVLWVGRFSAADKADLLPLIRAFASVPPSTGKPPLLVLAGTDRRHDSAYFEHYAHELGIADRVRVVRRLDPSVRHDWFAAADVFVSPVDNIQETFGLTPIEAMACGVPAVVSDWDGYRDTVVDGQTGFRIPTRWMRCDDDMTALAPVIFDEQLDHLALAQSVAVDVDVLAQRFTQLLGDAKLRERMGKAARERAVATYAWDRVIAQYEALWRDQLAQAKRTPVARNAARHAEWSLLPAFDAFGHYASEALSERSRIVITERGDAILDGREPLPVYHADGRVLSADALEDALVTLGDRGRRGTTIGTLARGLDARHVLGKAAAIRHAMWLLKYGHARVADR